MQYRVMAQSNRNTKQGVKYLYAEQYEGNAFINLLYMYVSLYVLLYITFNNVYVQITRQTKLNTEYITE